MLAVPGIFLQAPPPQHHLPPLYAGGFGGAPPYYDYNFLGPPGTESVGSYPSWPWLFTPESAGARISEPFGVQDFARRNSLEKDSDDDDDSEAERRQAHGPCRACSILWWLSKVHVEISRDYTLHRLAIGVRGFCTDPESFASV